MRCKLLTVAIAASLCVVNAHAWADPAQTLKLKKHKALTSNTQSVQSIESAQKAEIDALKAQLQVLQSKVDEIEARSDAQSDINVSQGQAVEAVQKAQATSDKKVAAIDKITNNTTLSGTMFFDTSHITEKNSDTGKTATTGTGFEVKRAYLGVTHKFNDIWSANLTTDFTYKSGLPATQVYIKKAYIQGKFDDAFALRVGSYDMPWIPFVESYYGYRYVDKTLTDRLSFGNSADWGVNVGGDVAGKMLNYSVSAVNGAGYKNPSRSKGMDFEGRVGFVPFDGFVVAAGGYNGHLGQDVENNRAKNTAQRGDILLAYADKNFRVGAEYFSANNWNTVTVATTDKSQGYSVWGNVTLSDVWSIFARYDKAKLSKKLDVNNKDVYYNAGVEYLVTKGFRLSLVYKYDKADKTVATHDQSTKKKEVGFFGEVKF